jgi:hypothetical protein
VRLVSAGILLFTAVLACAPSDVHAGARELVARVQTDLKRASEFGYNGDIKKVKKDEKEIGRYRNAQHSASNFDRHLSKGKFDKGELNSLIGNLKNVVDHNTLESRDRDALISDLKDLRDFRARD